MNTNQMGELFFLHTMVNDPIVYGENDEPQAAAAPAGDSLDLVSAVGQALVWLIDRIVRFRQALPQS